MTTHDAPVAVEGAGTQVDDARRPLLGPAGEGRSRRFPIRPRAVHEALLRVVREAANNAVRLGAATPVTLCLFTSGGGLHLTVGDNGSGFDPSAVWSGYGLRSMRERVEALGGTLRVRSAPGQETVI